jgi:hypothetical protein
VGGGDGPSLSRLQQNHLFGLRRSRFSQNRQTNIAAFCSVGARIDLLQIDADCGATSIDFLLCIIIVLFSAQPKHLLDLRLGYAARPLPWHTLLRVPREWPWGTKAGPHGSRWLWTRRLADLPPRGDLGLRLF